MNINSISLSLRPRYNCQADGYFGYENFWFNIPSLEEAPNEFIVTQETNLYYGYRIF